MKPLTPMLGMIMAATLALATVCQGRANAKTLDAADFGGDIAKALLSAKAGDTVRIPPGSFGIGGPLVLRSGVVLAGSGRDKTTITFNGAKGTEMVRVSGARDVGLTGFTLVGTGKGKATHGIVADNSQRISIKDLAVGDLQANGGFGPMAVYFSKAVTDSVVSGCEFLDIGVGAPFGSAIRMSWGSSRNRVEDNTIARTGRGGILANDGSTDLTIRRNRVTGSGGEGLGIEIWGGCDRSIVEDNVIDHWLSVDRSDFVAVRRNRVSDKSGTFKYLGLEYVGSQNAVFTDNTVDDGAIVGLSLSGDAPKRLALFARNTYTACSQWGAQLQGDKGGVDLVYLYKESFSATRTKHPSAPYPGDAGHGFRINGNARNLTLDSVEISGNGGLGIQVNPPADALSVIRSTITGNKGAAQSIPGMPNLEWAGNTVEGNRGNRQPNPKGFANAKPTVALVPVPTLRVGQAHAFSVQASDADGSVAHWLWDFGAGLPSDAARPTFAYDKAGTYAVILVVWDDKGRGTLAETTVTVTD